MSLSREIYLYSPLLTTLTGFKTFDVATTPSSIFALVQKLAVMRVMIRNSAQGWNKKNAFPRSPPNTASRKVVLMTGVLIFPPACAWPCQFQLGTHFTLVLLRLSRVCWRTLTARFGFADTDLQTCLRS